MILPQLKRFELRRGLLISVNLICDLFSRCSDSEITATPILDNPHLILLFYLTQLFLRELVRSYHLLKIIPMDMSGYFGEFSCG